MRTNTYIPMMVAPFATALANIKGRETMSSEFEEGYRCLRGNALNEAAEHFEEVLVHCDKATANELFWSVYQSQFLSGPFSDDAWRRYMTAVVSKPTHTPADRDAQYHARNNLWNDAKRHNWKDDLIEIEKMSFKVR